MVLDNNKLMLVFGLSEEDTNFLNKMIEELDLPHYRVIEKNMANMKIRDIIQGLKVDTYDKELPDEKIIMFNNYADYELDKAVRTIRANKDMKPILAIVTPTSIDWEFHYLVEHLMEEREQAKKYRQQKEQA
jgi:16S rRNA G527 N7-methylase RsmG